MRDKEGMAMLEMAFLVPVVVLILVVGMVLGLTINAKMTVSNTAHEAGRAAAVVADAGRVREVAESSILGGNLMLDYGDLETFDKNDDVRIRRDDGMVTVDVRYRQPTIVPAIGGLLGNPDFWGSYLQVQASATFVDETTL